MAVSAVDGPGGIDNQFGGLLNGLQCADPYYSSDTINNQIQSGEDTLLFTVSRYNFSPSDDDVTLTIRVGGALANPTFTIADTWPIAMLPSETVPFAFVSPPRSVYVTGGILVGKFDLMPLRIGLGATTLFGVTLHGAVIRCRIEFVGSNPKLTECALAGAWRAQDLLASLGAVFAQDAGVPVCVSDPGFAFTQDAIDSICGGADLAVQPNRGCDAVSFGAAFETTPVNIGAPQVVNRPSYACPNVPDCRIPDQ